MSELEDPARARTRTAVGACALVLALLGLALLFAGSELSALALGTPLPEPIPAVMGAAFLGFASMNWIARHNILGGIYGRAVVGANQTHFMIGAIVLVKHLLTHASPSGLWILAAVYVAGAVLFTGLLRGRGLPRPSASASRP